MGFVWEGPTAVGTVTRTKLYSGAKRATRRKVTKGCHLCQAQHVSFTCGSGAGRGGGGGDDALACLRSFCRDCVARNFPELVFEDAVASCPSCRGLCSCLRCARLDAPPPQPQPPRPVVRALCARYALRVTARMVAAWMAREGEEVGPALARAFVWGGRVGWV
eukprot:196725-Chlamydomonas_euryale.AAC.1